MEIRDKMKILVVGGAGYIGGFLTDYLIENGCDVTVYDVLLFEDRFLKKCKFIYGDIRDKDKLSNIIGSYDVVVWLAGLVGGRRMCCQPQINKGAKCRYSQVACGQL